MLEKHQNKLEIQSETISGLEIQFYRLIYTALDKGNSEGAKRVYLFVLKKISESISRRSLSVFRQLIQIPTWIYRDTIKRFSTEQIYFRNELISFWLDLLSIYMKIEARKAKTKDEKDEFNHFLRFIYHEYLSILYLAIFFKQDKDFEYAISKLVEGADYYERKPFNTRMKIEHLARTKGSVGEALVLEEEIYENEYSTVLYFHSLFVIQSWVWYFYSEGKVSEEKILEYTEKINLSYDNAEDLLNDFVKIQSSSHLGYLGIDYWKLTEDGESGVVDDIPQVHEWLTLGLVLYLLRSRQTKRIDIDLIYNDTWFRSLNELVKEALVNIRFHFDTWKLSIACETIEEFDERSREVQVLFDQLRRRFVSIEESEIAQQDISETLVKEFNQVIYNGWKDSSRIRVLFEHFGKLNRTNEDILHYKVYGYNTFFLKAKMMFTEKNYQQIMGIGDLGRNLGRRLDETFFKAILPVNNIKPYKSIPRAINDFIKALKHSKFEPDLIILPPEFLVEETLKADPNFIPRWQITEVKIPDQIAEYDGIPVFASYTKTMKNKVIVCRFVEAFEFELYKSNNLIEDELNVEVKSITPEMAKERFEENKEKWSVDEDGNKLNEEEALNRILASVNIVISVNGLFKDINPSAYLVAEIDKEVIGAIGL